ncbi:MAG: rhomboid family intramembrane serine protease [Candidatus Aenigmarchaeota archaeon]|nr:rhomboid family intramembrane serine protease [Candidatus Aenigmarchaeota archaeon]
MVLRLNWTISFFIACVAVFFLQILLPIDWEMFSFTPALAMERPWTFVTAMFMHANITHLFFNMFVLLMFGLMLENIIGHTKYAIIYFTSGIIGSIGYLLTASSSMIPAVGASGAIYGIMGTMAVLMPFQMVWVFGFFPMPMVVAAAFWVLSEFIGLFAPGNIAHGAHLGGLFMGFLSGAYLRWRYMKHQKRRRVGITGYADWEM